MFFSKCEIDLSAIKGRISSGGEYGLHKQVWKLFPNSERRDFLYRKMEGNIPTVYVLSDQRPSSDSAIWKLAIKEYCPKLVAGAHYAFSLRANPTVSRKDGTASRGTRHDVVMNAKRESRHKDQSEVEQETGSAWLHRRALSKGFSVESVSVGGYQQHRLRKQAGKTIQFSTLDFDGVLSIEDEALMLKTLAAGIGPAKGFGCGMLMIRPL